MPKPKFRSVYSLLPHKTFSIDTHIPHILTLRHQLLLTTCKCKKAKLICLLMTISKYACI